MANITVMQRIKLAAKIATGLFNPEDVSAAQGLLGGIFHGSSGTWVERGTAELLDSFNTSPWARACSLRVADAVSAVHWRLYVARRNGRPIRHAALEKAAAPVRQKLLKKAARDGELQEIENHLLLDVLRDGNTEFNGPELWWLHSITMDLTGDAFYVKQRNLLGVPEALWPVPAHWVASTPTPSRPVYRVAYRGWQKEISQTEMLWAKNPNPVNPYWRGTGIARALDDELELDEFAVKHRKAFFRNNARPDILVMPKDGGVLGDVERGRLEQWWTDKLQGFWRAYKPLFLTAPMEVKLLEQNFQQMQFSELRSQEADIILQVWGVPPELFGRLQNSNRSTITAAMQIFGRSVLVPRLERARHWLQANLVPEYDAPLILDYDNPVPEDDDFALAVMKAQPRAFQLNEFRDLAGRQPDDVLMDEYGAPTPIGAQPLPSSEAALEQLTDEELKQMRTILTTAATRQTIGGRR